MVWTRPNVAALFIKKAEQLIEKAENAQKRASIENCAIIRDIGKKAMNQGSDIKSRVPAFEPKVLVKAKPLALQNKASPICPVTKQKSFKTPMNYSLVQKKPMAFQSTVHPACSVTHESSMTHRNHSESSKAPMVERLPFTQRKLPKAQNQVFSIPAAQRSTGNPLSQQNSKGKKLSLKERFKNGDPQVGLLGEQSGKFDYYVLYSGKKELNIPFLPPSEWDTNEDETPTVMKSQPTIQQNCSMV